MTCLGLPESMAEIRAFAREAMVARLGGRDDVGDISHVERDRTGAVTMCPQNNTAATKR